MKTHRKEATRDSSGRTHCMGKKPIRFSGRTRDVIWAKAVYRRIVFEVAGLRNEIGTSDFSKSVCSLLYNDHEHSNTLVYDI